MKISREKLGQVASDLLRILDREGFRNTKRIKRSVEQAIPVTGREQDSVVIGWRPSNHGTLALDVSYVIQNGPEEIIDIPLDVKINPELHYTTIILKSDFRIPSYDNFEHDSFGNFIQSKTLEIYKWGDLRPEIASICLLCC